MNTEKSDKMVEQWRKTVHPLQRSRITRQRIFNTSPDRLFPLLCPTTEYDWLPGWHCQLLHSDSGYAEYNAVFTTGFFGREELWVCTGFEPNRAIEYARTSQDNCAKMDIRLSDNDDGTVTGTWVITVSALNQQGNVAVAELAASEQAMEQVLDALAYYVDKGVMKP